MSSGATGVVVEPSGGPAVELVVAPVVDAASLAVVVETDSVVVEGVVVADPVVVDGAVSESAPCDVELDDRRTDVFVSLPSSSDPGELPSSGADSSVINDMSLPSAS